MSWVQWTNYLRDKQAAAQRGEIPQYAYVYFDITIDGEAAGRILFRLFWRDCPVTTENFMALADGHKGYGYKDANFHRVIPGYIIQGGDITKGDGTGGRSIYFGGGAFPSENYLHKHNQKGLLCMATFGPDTAQSQFYITMRDHTLTHLDKKDVVFGKVLEDPDDVCQKINDCGDVAGKVHKDIRIAACGTTTAPRPT